MFCGACSLGGEEPCWLALALEEIWENPNICNPISLQEQTNLSQGARRLEGDDGIWAMVIAGGGYPYVKRSRIQFERDICFVVDPGNNISEVIPKKIDRVDAVTLVVSTGFPHYGDVRMIFDSSKDADMIEQKLKAQLSKSRVKNAR